MEQKLATCLRTEREPRLETQREPAVVLARLARLEIWPTSTMMQRKPAGDLAQLWVQPNSKAFRYQTSAAHEWLAA